MGSKTARRRARRRVPTRAAQAARVARPTSAGHPNGRSRGSRQPAAAALRQQGPPPLTVWSALATAAAVVLFGQFVYRHGSHWVRTGRVAGLVFTVHAVVLVVLFLCRQRPFELSRRPLDWMGAMVGTFGLLLLRPGGSALASRSLYTGLQMAGVGLSIWCLLHLGRSFGIVAANRGVRSSGPYGLVRHPMYASYVLIEVGFLLSAWSPFNGAVLGVVWAAQLYRALAEERVLRNDPSYRRYAARVRWRLVPGVF